MAQLVKTRSAASRGLARTVIDLVAALAALDAGYRHRAQLKALTPERLADCGMSEQDRAAAVQAPITAHPAYREARSRIAAGLVRMFRLG